MSRSEPPKGDNFENLFEFPSLFDAIKVIYFLDKRPVFFKEMGWDGIFETSCEMGSHEMIVTRR